MPAFGELLDRMDDWVDAKRELHRCVSGCDEDRDYFCADQYRRVEEARAAYERAFADAVLEAVLNAAKK